MSMHQHRSLSGVAVPHLPALILFSVKYNFTVLLMFQTLTLTLTLNQP